MVKLGMRKPFSLHRISGSKTRVYKRSAAIPASVDREFSRLIRGGASVSREGVLRPTRKQVESFRKGFERLEKQKINLFSRGGALAFASELSRSGEHYAAGRIRALAVEASLSKMGRQKWLFRIRFY